MDDNCNGQVDENCYCEVAVDLSGDCLSIYCPAECPYPIGCDIDMAGGDPRGCVASTPTNSKVYFQEGNNCGAGKVTGTLLCASVPGVGLTKNTCAINKPQKFYPSSKGGCPDTN